MTDQELLGYEREHHGDPYMNLADAKALRHTALQFWHLGADRERAEGETREDARRNLRAKLWRDGREK